MSGFKVKKSEQDTQDRNPSGLFSIPVTYFAISERFFPARFSSGILFFCQPLHLNRTWLCLRFLTAAIFYSRPVFGFLATIGGQRRPIRGRTQVNEWDPTVSAVFEQFFGCDSSMEVETLIHSVDNHHLCLWDKSDTGFANKVERNKTWRVEGALVYEDWEQLQNLQNERGKLVFS